MDANIKNILVSHGLAPSKKRGQNFLKHRATAQAIITQASFSENDHIVEVGVGLGALTLCLARSVLQVTGIEIDRGIVQYHEQERILPGNVELIHQDVLKTDFSALHNKIGTPLKIISNLPYSISNPFIFKLIDNRSAIDQVVILLQKEMADRLMAKPHSKEYGIPTILLQSCADVVGLMKVGAAEFNPRPKVDSLLIRIMFDHHKIPESLFGWLRNMVRASFSSRRKTVVNNLLASFPFPEGVTLTKPMKRKLIGEALEKTGLRGDIRAEDISIQEFKQLAEYMQDLG